MSGNAKPALLVSPNSVLANALLRSIDLLRPRVLAMRPARVEFVVGTQINGAPHLGTNLVQTAAFLLAKIARREFSLGTRVRFSALDNAPHDVMLDPERALGTPAAQMPVRIFTPQVLAHTGAKLSKSLLREQGKGVLPADVEPWMLDTTAWPSSVDQYVDNLIWLVGELLTGPKHFFRSFTVKELGRLITASPTTLPARAHEMGIYKRYFDLIASGVKTTEIRVNDSSRRKIKPGSLIRFRCREEHVLTRVVRVARYASFEEMFDHEKAQAVNPTASREEQLANIRQIYPPEREALGVVAIGIELVDPLK